MYFRSFIFIVNKAEKNSSEAETPWKIGGWSNTLRSEFERYQGQMLSSSSIYIKLETALQK